MSGVPSLLFLTCGAYYRHGAGILMLLSAAKVAAVCSGFYGLVL
jgi:hypothetical protein